MSIGKLNEFNSESGSWTTYIDRIEQYFVVNDVDEEMKVPTLIACVGDSTYELMVDLCSPKKPSELNFKELVVIVKNHLQPAPSVLAERYKFRKRVQLANETVSQFAAALKHLARTCDFKKTLEENLRDQFICGLIDESIRQRLFCENDPTYQVALQLAVSLESAAKDAASVEQRGREREGAVHAVHATFSGRRHAPPPQRGRSASKRDARSERNDRPTRNQQNIVCSCCGSNEHLRQFCKFKDYVCKVCLREGHLKRVCPKVHRRNEGQVLRLEASDEPGGEVRQSSLVAPGPKSTGPGAHFQYEYEDNGPEGLYMVELGGSGSEPVTADVEVAGVRLRMHVDTGSPISCISELMYDQLFSQWPLRRAVCYKLKGYDGQPLECVGCFEVNVCFQDRNKKLMLYVIKKGGVPLLGREWLKELRLDIIVVNSIQSDDTVNEKDFCEELIKKYPTVFSGKPGECKSFTATLRVREGAHPVYRRARPLPLALLPRVDAELRRLESAG